MLRALILTFLLDPFSTFANPSPSQIRIDKLNSLAIELGFERGPTGIESRTIVPPDLRHLIFDIRNVRGGHGDVAAAYLIAEDLKVNFGFNGTLTFIVTPRANHVLNMLNPDFADPERAPARLIDALKIPPELPPADLLIEVAAPRGCEFDQGRYQNIEIKSFTRRADKIPVHGGTVFATIPVFSASEDHRRFDSHIALSYRHVLFNAPPPGPAAGEAGVYPDPSATEIRDAGPERLPAIVHEELKRIAPRKTQAYLERVLTSSDRTLAFVYGVSHRSTGKQFASYLRGLIDQVPSRVLVVTPSGLNASELREFNPADLRVFVSGDLEWESASAKVVVVQIPEISNRLFNALLARSEIPPIVAGDNALSAIRILGVPFVMTQVDWNKAIVRSVFRDLILRSPTVPTLAIFNEVIEENLYNAYALRGTGALFRASAGRARNLTETLLALVDRVRLFVDHEAGQMSARDLKRHDSRALNARVLVRQLTANAEYPFAIGDHDEILLLGLAAGIRRSAFSPAELALPAIDGYLRRQNSREFSDTEENYLAAAQAAPATSVTNLIDRLGDKLKLFSARAGQVAAPMMQDRIGYASVVNAGRVLDALDAIGTDRAYAAIAAHGLTFPFDSVVARSRFLLLNHWARAARPEPIKGLIDQMADDEVSWFAQSVSDNTFGAFIRPEVLRYLLTKLPENHWDAKILRARLAKYERVVAPDCAGRLARAD